MDKDKLLRRYLNGDLSPEEEQQALHVIADDPEMRSMLRFEQRLSDSLSGDMSLQDDYPVPEGFADKVMHRIEQKQGSSASEGIFEVLKSWYRQLWIPQQVQWRPAYGFVMVLLVLVSLSYPLVLTQGELGQQPASENQQVQNLNNSVQQVSAGSDEVMLRFVYIDENANSVAVAGDFNNWEPTELTRQSINGKTVWTALVSMSRGEHNYMFVKNGDKWVTDPLAPVQRDDGFGNKNAVIYI